MCAHGMSSKPLMDCSGLIDEPSAANNVLMRDGAIVDVGAAPPGSPFNDSQVTYTATNHRRHPFR
jgi:Ethanolamine utilization protein EutJ (predicted chaperonin)